MGTRLDLQTLLASIVPGTGRAYYQPPESVQMEYPCIVYKRMSIEGTRANNGLYSHKTLYQVTAITSDPDDTWHFDILGLPLCSHDRSYVADGLHHDVFELYY